MQNDCCFTSGNDFFRYRTGAIIIEENCVLFMGNKITEYLYTVGGGVHLGEKSEDCIKREVLEETGIEYEIDRLVAITENFFSEKSGMFAGFDCHVIEFYFLMKSKGKKFYTKTIDIDSDIEEEQHWVPLDEIQNYNIKPSFLKDELQKIIQTKNILHFVTEKDK